MNPYNHQVAQEQRYNFQHFYQNRPNYFQNWPVFSLFYTRVYGIGYNSEMVSDTDKRFSADHSLINYLDAQISNVILCAAVFTGCAKKKGICETFFFFRTFYFFNKNFHRETPESGFIRLQRTNQRTRMQNRNNISQALISKLCPCPECHIYFFMKKGAFAKINKIFYRETPASGFIVN
jgi:hypothetical protein